MPEITGTADYTVGSETFQTWYKVVGDLKSGVRPLVAVHGSRVDHHYMLPHVELSIAHNIPVVFYDQLGVGKSSHLRNKPADFITVDLFVNELDNLLKHLGIIDDFDLLGHSWGGIIASTYASHRVPKGLHHLVLANAPASIELLDKGTHALLKTLPENVQDTIWKHQAAGTTTEKEYQEAVMVFYKSFFCCVDPWPEELLASFAAVAQDPTVYNATFGPIDFITTGTLKGWEISDKLSSINVPTLLINGVKDGTQDVTVLPYFQNISKVKWVQTNVGTHLPFIEEKERYFSVLIDFLKTT